MVSEKYIDRRVAEAAYAVNQTTVAKKDDLGIGPSFVPSSKLANTQMAAATLSAAAAGITAASLTAWIAAQIAEGASLGQFEGLYKFEEMIASKLGWSEMSVPAIMLPFEKAVLKPAEQYYNSVYTPEIPPYTDLINMRVKEKITQEDFTSYLKFQGFDAFWSGKLWDAHFMAPNLDDVLTAWRRKIIDEKRVDDLMVLIDLDPFYKDVFDTRKYVDPSITMARFMFETGAIGKAGVKDIIHRNGYNEKDTNALVEFVVRFQERRFRLRYITTLMMGGFYDVYPLDEIVREVVNAGYTVETGVVITKIIDARKRIARERHAIAGSKLLGLGELKAAFIKGKINEDRFRSDLLERGYPLDDIEILIELLKEQSGIEKAGGAVTLSVSQLLDAWRYDVISEDDLRNRLLARGLELLEVDTLVETKRKQWTIGEKIP